MDPLCEFCGVVKPFVYCKPDSARLCLQCDGCVHSANSLSRRHPRSLLCDMCHSQPATAHCLDDKMSLCQGCELNPNGCSVLGHRCQALNCYTGCPSWVELSRMWPFVFDLTSSGGFDNGLASHSSLPLNDSCVSKPLKQPTNDDSFGLMTGNLNETEPYVECEPWMEQSSVIRPNPDHMPYCRDQAILFPQESNLREGCPDLKDLGIHDGDDLCEDLNIDDVQLNLESDEIFGCFQGATKYQLENGGIDCLLMERNPLFTESTDLVESAMEASASASAQQNCVAFQSSSAGGSASAVQAINSHPNCIPINPTCNRNINLGFPQDQVHSSISLSLSNITGESSATTDYQDCGLSPVFLTSETPWESKLEATQQARDKAKMRYNEKKKTRIFGKQIRYTPRKARADTRKCVKGRFAKAVEAYDYDPLVTKHI